MTKTKKPKKQQSKKNDDGNIIAARTHLTNAISALIDTKPYLIRLDLGHTHITYLDSLYHQLADAITANRGGGISGVFAARLPLWAAGLDLLIKIDATTKRWHPDYDPTSPENPTVLRLQALDTRTWRPQDTSDVETIATTITGWCDQIAAFFAAKPLELTEPCPRCRAKWAYRDTDGDGKPIRQRALHVTVDRAACGNCHATWPPDQFQFLGKLLRCPPPAGITPDPVP